MSVWGKVWRSALVLATAAAVVAWALARPAPSLRFVDGTLSLSSQGALALPGPGQSATESRLVVRDSGSLAGSLFLDLATKGPVTITVRRRGLVYRGRGGQGLAAGRIGAHGQAVFLLVARRSGPGPLSARFRFTATAP